MRTVFSPPHLSTVNLCQKLEQDHLPHLYTYIAFVTQTPLGKIQNTKTRYHAAFFQTPQAHFPDILVVHKLHCCQQPLEISSTFNR